MTWDRGEIAPGIPNVKQNIQLIQGERIDLDTLVRGAGAGDVTYQFSGDSKDCVLSGSQLTAGETLGSVSADRPHCPGQGRERRRHPRLHRRHGDILSHRCGPQDPTLGKRGERERPAVVDAQGRKASDLRQEPAIHPLRRGRERRRPLLGGAAGQPGQRHHRPERPSHRHPGGQGPGLRRKGRGRDLCRGESKPHRSDDPARPADHPRPGQNGGGRGVGPQPEQR